MISGCEASFVMGASVDSVGCFTRGHKITHLSKGENDFQTLSGGTVDDCAGDTDGGLSLTGSGTCASAVLVSRHGPTHEAEPHCDAIATTTLRMGRSRGRRTSFERV
jgi:hypothetical protein